MPFPSTFETIYVLLANGDSVGSCQFHSAVFSAMTNFVASFASLSAWSRVVALTLITHRVWAVIGTLVLVLSLVNLTPVLSLVGPIVVAEIVAPVVVVVVVVVAGAFLPLSLVSSSSQLGLFP